MIKKSPIAVGIVLIYESAVRAAEKERRNSKDDSRRPFFKEIGRTCGRGMSTSITVHSGLTK